ncbi:unnamed protein product [Arctogadus glacialis]
MMMHVSLPGSQITSRLIIAHKHWVTVNCTEFQGSCWPESKQAMGIGSLDFIPVLHVNLSLYSQPTCLVWTQRGGALLLRSFSVAD